LRGPSEIATTLQKAVALHQQGRLPEASALYEAILKADPQHFDAQCLLGVVESQRMNFQAAVEHFGHALMLNPNSIPAHASMGDALLALGRFTEAVASFDRALEIEPSLSELLNNRGNALLKLERREDALASYNRSLAIKPGAAEVLCNRGNVLRELGRPEEALADYAASLSSNPDYAQALYRRGAALRDLKRHLQALAAYTAALAIKPDYAEALCDRGNALLELNRHDEAIADYARALTIRPQFAEALYNRGIALSALGHHEAAAQQFIQLLHIEPDFPYARGELFYSQLHCCNWADYADSVQRIERDTVAGKPAATPFAFLSVADSPADQLQCARIYCKGKCTPPVSALWTGEHYRHDSLRVAYISADFYNHATSYLTVELFELHDKSRFETYAISLGPSRKDAMRARLESAFNRFVDVRDQSDREVARLLRALEIDIAVDLKGYTRDCRPNILAFRPAPIQVNYLGYPGTMGAPYIDYILADRFVIPERQRAFYSENVVYLPDTYQPNDSKRRIGEEIATRHEVGLPEACFVFCSFVSHYKIGPRVFDAWMSILATVAGSVLWLLAGAEQAMRNLRRYAETRGIAAERLIFAPRMTLERHLARHRLADLFLDTLPINAHTAASDALWAGLPLVTCLGCSFAARVAGSLLNALELTELITETREEYVALAVNLARDVNRLAAIRAKLAHNRGTRPLFDTDRLRRHIESAYETMSERRQRGEPPVSFTVTPYDRSRPQGRP
jgi:predicted O-linked N-acetylglucosamine transferase (SPINDLY family)